MVAMETQGFLQCLALVLQVNNTAALAARGISSLAVAKKVVEVFGMMTFYHGFVHCDPHAGNLLVTGEGNKFQVVSATNAGEVPILLTATTTYPAGGP